MSFLTSSCFLLSFMTFCLMCVCVCSSCVCACVLVHRCGYASVCICTCVKEVWKPTFCSYCPPNFLYACVYVLFIYIMCVCRWLYPFASGTEIREGCGLILSLFSFSQGLSLKLKLASHSVLPIFITNWTEVISTYIATPRFLNGYWETNSNLHCFILWAISPV